jgi:phosphoribosylformylglycinamidine synthase
MLFKKPKVIIPTGLGINSEKELCNIFELVGADVDLRHINDLIDNPKLLERYKGAGFPGGFSMGDELGAGQSLANRIKHSDLYEKLQDKVDDPDFPIYCVCNWLQVFAKLDLFPVKVGTLVNDSGKHETGYWDIDVNLENDTVWISSMKGLKQPVFAPISHTEGRIYVEDLENAKNLVAMRYTNGYLCDYLRSSRTRYNPNGSMEDIAGFGWANNLVLFPHFERLHHDFQRPDRAEIKQDYKKSSFYWPTILMFIDAVNYMKKN